MARTRHKPGPLPSREAVLDFIRANPGRAGKREIARAFGVRGTDRAALKAMLAELEEAGQLAPTSRRGRGAAGRLPPVTVIQVTGTDLDGEVLARPTRWHGDEAPPRIYLAARARGIRAPGVGDRLLARLRPLPDGAYEAEPIRRIASAPARVLGVYGLAERGARVRPTDRRYRNEIEVPRGESGAARPGDLVLVETMARDRLGLPRGRVVEVLGRADEPGAISLIAIHTHGIPVAFAKAALEQADAARPAPAAGRRDLRRLPLVTIDGPDARDFDDAVFAEPDPTLPGGWHLVIAIADVAWYVRPGDALDRAALERGNSAYFPDRVVPMLPEALSNDLCSLRPGTDRACLAAHVWIDREGRIRRHRFERAVMRSAARLTYEQAQAVHEGRPDDVTGPLAAPVIAPLYGAYEALATARRARGALEIELPERVVEFGPDGRIARIAPRPRLDSHKLIEEFMIAANVAAAEALEQRRLPVMFRVHDAPDPAKLAAMADFLAGLGLRLAKAQAITTPAQLNRILARAAGTPHQNLVNMLVLRSQARAVYAPDNLGHFGLGLKRYCHFTSPIRRYADILVHRALIRAFDLGAGGLPGDAGAGFGEIGELISGHERRAVAAERDALDRYAAAFLAARVGATFRGRINGVTRFGLFVTLDETGADGIAPIRLLPGDDYVHDERHHALVGRRTGRAYTLGDGVEVRLAEADPITGALAFEILGSLAERPPGGTKPAETPRRRARSGHGRIPRPARTKKGGGRKRR